MNYWNILSWNTLLAKYCEFHLKDFCSSSCVNPWDGNY